MLRNNTEERRPYLQCGEGLISRNRCFLQDLEFLSVLVLGKLHYVGKDKGKAVPLQARRGPEGSKKLMFLDFVTTAQDGGEVVSLMHRPPLPPGNTPGTHFC